MTYDIAPTDDLATCLALRWTVFVEEQKVPEDEEVDDLEDVSQHFLATWAGEPAGTARLTIEGDTAKIGRVCVLPQHRGTGLGAALIRATLEAARTLPGVQRAKLGAQVQAIGFYERLGFRAIGPVYDDAGIDHRDMVRDL